MVVVVIWFGLLIIFIGIMFVVCFNCLGLENFLVLIGVLIVLGVI